MHHLTHPTMASYEITVNQDIYFDLPQTPYILIIAIHSQHVKKEWRYACCDWIVKNAQCYHAMTWGFDCSQWESDLDLSFIEQFNYDPPDDVMFLTTWHEDENFKEVIEHAKFCTSYLPNEHVRQIVILNIR